MKPERTTPTHPVESDRLEQEASRWVVLEDRGLTDTEQASLKHWLAESEVHLEYLETKRREWALLSRLGAGLREQVPTLEAACRPNRLELCLGWLQSALPIAAALLLGLFLLKLAPIPSSRPPEPAVFAITPASKELCLEDGTRVFLQPGASLTQHYSPAERRVILSTGSATFHVAKSPGRPFVVVAGTSRLQALGTVFEVDLHADAMQVRVTEGRVRLSTHSEAANAPVLTAGESAHVFNTEAQPGLQLSRTPEGLALQSKISEPSLLEFAGVPLAKVVDELNSLNRLQLRLAEPSLATLPVVASIKSDNVEGFVRLLCSDGRLVYHKTGDIVLVSRASHTVTSL